MRLYSSEFWAAFDEHMLEQCADQPGTVDELIRTAVAACTYRWSVGRPTAGTMRVYTDPLYAGRKLVEGGNVLFWSDDIRNLFLDLDLAPRLTEADPNGLMDSYSLMVGRWLSRHGYRAAAVAEQDRLDRRAA